LRPRIFWDTMDTLTVCQTVEYARWFTALRDSAARVSIDARLRRLALGHVGDCRLVGDGVLELRIDCGPGYRVCFRRHAGAVIVLLAGGDKSSQARDIERAKRLAQEVSEGWIWEDQ
jgi:putative addiction module killer protein